MSEKYFFIYLRPLDVLMFRPPRPFFATVDFEARSMDLPHPKTVAGAIAAEFYKKDKVKFQDKSSKEILKKVNVQLYSYGWALYSQGNYERLYPVPMSRIFEVVCSSSQRDNIMNFLKVRESLKSLFKKDPEELTVNFLISEDGLKEECEINRYLVRKDNVYSRELRIGIKLSKGKTVEEEYFYRAEFLRPNKDSRIWILAKGPEDVIKGLEGSLIRFGGRGRQVEVEFVENGEGKKTEIPKNFWADLISYGRYAKSQLLEEDALRVRVSRCHSFPEWAIKAIPRKGLEYSSGWDLSKLVFVGYLALPGSSYCGSKEGLYSLSDRIEVFSLSNGILYLFEGGPEEYTLPLNFYALREVSKNGC